MIVRARGHHDVVVIRSAGERTFEVCRKLLLEQVPAEAVEVVCERPFERALIRSYEIGIERAGCPKQDILWVTGHQWEAFGAVCQGLRVAWTNRAQQPKLEIGINPTYTTKHLQELADLLDAGVASES